MEIKVTFVLKDRREASVLSGALLGKARLLAGEADQTDDIREKAHRATEAARLLDLAQVLKDAVDTAEAEGGES